MIQSALLFSLGFLCAVFLALVMAPRLSRRAARLARRRIEASVPLTKAEIEAERDSVRAEYATAVRRLEINLKSVKDKAANLGIELGRKRDKIQDLGEDRDAKAEEIASLEKTLGEVRATLAERETELEDARARLEDDRQKLEHRAGEIEELGRLYEEASFSSSSRQIELVAREGEIERLNEEMTTLRNRHREAERQMRQAESEKKTADETFKAEKKKTVDLEARLERMLTTLSDREEKLERREKDIERLRGSVEASALSENPEMPEERRGEKDAELGRMSALLSEAGSGDMESAVDRVSVERDRLAARLTALVRENKRLRASLSSGDGHSEKSEQRENALLREQISDLAAEVVHLAAKLDGPGSDVARALAHAQGEEAKQGAAHITSLSDRVRALQKASAAGSS